MLQDQGKNEHDPDLSDAPMSAVLQCSLMHWMKTIMQYMAVRGTVRSTKQNSRQDRYFSVKLSNRSGVDSQVFSQKILTCRCGTSFKKLQNSNKVQTHSKCADEVLTELTKQFCECRKTNSSPPTYLPAPSPSLSSHSKFVAHHLFLSSSLVYRCDELTDTQVVAVRCCCC